VERLREERAAVVTAAYQQADAEAAALGSRRGDAWPAELARRAPRWATLEAALRRCEAQAQADAAAARQRRTAAEAERAQTGKSRRGKAPQPVRATPADTAQRHLTAPARPIMRTTHKGWESCGHAHASVDAACPMIVACDVTDATNDTQPAEPMAQATRATLAQAGLERPKDASGDAPAIPATLDNGDDSAAAGEAREPLGGDPSIATERQRHQGPQAEAPETPATVPERIAATVRTPAGKALYARRKVIVAPVCGQSKEARGFRRFWLRGLDAIRGAWRLIGLTHHLLKMWRYGSAQSAASGRREIPSWA
jgi:Transposase DDE domain